MGQLSRLELSHSGTVLEYFSNLLVYSLYIYIVPTQYTYQYAQYRYTVQFNWLIIYVLDYLIHERHLFLQFLLNSSVTPGTYTHMYNTTICTFLLPQQYSGRLVCFRLQQLWGHGVNGPICSMGRFADLGFEKLLHEHKNRTEQNTADQLLLYPAARVRCTPICIIHQFHTF